MIMTLYKIVSLKYFLKTQNIVYHDTIYVLIGCLTLAVFFGLRHNAMGAANKEKRSFEEKICNGNHEFLSIRIDI